MIQFQVQIKVLNCGTILTEDYTKDISDPEQWAREMISRFNNDCGSHQSRRELVGIKVTGEDMNTLHDWQREGGENYRDDTVKNFFCVTCGITGKKLQNGGSNPVIRDFKWRAKKYHYCDGERKC